jgi:transposase
MPGTAEAVEALVRKEFPGATVFAAYEAGYSGFWLHRKLEAAGISCIVVHVNSIEVSSRDMVKTDPLDAVYRSVPGIGSLIARVLSSELGDMSQFPNAQALFSFTGLTLTEYSSEGHICRGHISR